MKKTKLLIFIILAVVFTGIAYSEDEMYSWVDPMGEVVYSNSKPHTNRKIQIKEISKSTSISDNSVFIRKIKKKEKDKDTTDDEFEEAFDKLGVLIPILPTSDDAAITKLKRIIADELVFIKATYNNVDKYIKEYNNRKKAYEHELKLKSSKEKFWKPRIYLESEELFVRKLNKYKKEIDIHSLLLKWASAKLKHYK